MTYIAASAFCGLEFNERTSCITSTKGADAIETMPLTRAMGDICNAGIKSSSSLEPRSKRGCLDTILFTRSTSASLPEESNSSLCFQNVFGSSPCIASSLKFSFLVACSPFPITRDHLQSLEYKCTPLICVQCRLRFATRLIYTEWTETPDQQCWGRRKLKV